MLGAIVLAAGQSRRMGVNKLLLPFGGITIISHIVDQLLASVLGETIVVVEHNPQPIMDELGPRPVSFVVNDHPEDGMLSSLRCGLQALHQQTHGFLVALGDQPAITAEVIDALAQAFKTGEKGIWVPVHEGSRGHPILITARYRDEVLREYDDVGLRGLLHAHPEDVGELPLDAPGVLEDMDTPEDYQRALDRFNI